ncbi:MAG TPA: hypothetical protein VHG08_10790 [Longimicrobium sp.]|nr:hypothetical protein [Longimicrobium sp.]
MRLRTFVGRADESIFATSTPGLSPAAALIEESINEAYDHWRQTLTSERSSLEEEFRRLAAEWKTAAEFQSSITRIAMHPAYQRIIGMGQEALPYILRDLEMTQAPWFWALQAITGVDPVSMEDRGYVDRMTRAWVRWGMRENII